MDTRIRFKYSEVNVRLAGRVRDLLRDTMGSEFSMNEAVQVALTSWLEERSKKARKR